MQIFDAEQKLKFSKVRLKDLMQCYNSEGIKTRLNELQVMQEEGGFFSEIQKAKKVGQELKVLRKRLSEIATATNKLENFEMVVELIKNGATDLDNEYNKCENELDNILEIMTINTFFSGEYDDFPAIMELHAGAGGEEAQDWTEMVLRMYKLYFSKNDYEVEVIDYNAGDGAGVKNITMLIHGENAYGKLKGESGVHRLVRLSPFDSNNRRHTSFTSVEVTPFIEEDNSIIIKPDDIRIDTYRSSGAGGQHVNKTDSAVRITHLESGIVVQCQNERSQLQNKETAMKMLKGKLIARREEEKQRLKDSIDVKRIEWGSQIRSYVLQPYNLVKDLRTGYETSDTTAVLAGDIEKFIFEYLKYINS
ncbi:MAG: peptide chain release factor 2 [Clostridia bacterium]